MLAFIFILAILFISLFSSIVLTTIHFIVQAKNYFSELLAKLKDAVLKNL